MAKIVNQDADIEIEEVKGDGATAHEDGGALVHFVEKNRNLLLGGFLAIAVAIGGWLFWQNQSAGKNEKAQAAAFQAEYYFQQDSLAKALNGDGKAKGFLSIEKEYSGTKMGNLAKYYIGQIYLRQGKTAEGMKYLESFDKGNNLASAMAYASLGTANQDLGKWEEAAGLFEKAANVTGAKDDQLKPFFLLSAGQSYEQAKKTEKALEIYKTIKEKYPQSQEGQVVDKYIGRVGNE